MDEIRRPEQNHSPKDEIKIKIDFEDPGHFLEEAAEAFHIVSPQGVIVWANKKELELMGYGKEEYIGHHISEFYADRFVINDILCRLVYGQEVVNYPAELIRKDGTRIQVLLNSNVYSRDGDFIHARSCTRDVSDLKLFQTRLESSNALVLNQLMTSNTLLNLVASISLVTDYQGCITTLQTKWQAYSGQDFSEQENYGWLKSFHPDDRIAIKANLIAAIRENHDYKQLARVYKKSVGDYVNCGIYATPIIGVQNHSFEWNFIIIDDSKTTPPDEY